MGKAYGIWWLSGRLPASGPNWFFVLIKGIALKSALNRTGFATQSCYCEEKSQAHKCGAAWVPQKNGGSRTAKPHSRFCSLDRAQKLFGGSRLKLTALYLSLILPAASLVATAQSFSTSVNPIVAESISDGGAPQVSPSVRNTSAEAPPFSRFAIGGGISVMGINLQAATNINRHFNIRGTGNVFKYSTDFTTNGLTANASLNLASAGVALDYYPTKLGFRLSPGLLLYNGNQLTASDTVAGGTSFTLNNQTFYSANANSTTGATPVNGNASLGLNTTKPAFTITTGWGNMIPRKGGHLSFPVEIGVAVTGQPSLNATLAGWACYDQAQTQCTDISSSTDPIAIAVQSDLQAQITKWKSDLSPLKTYPIISFGVAYAFHIR
jgi:hypothetical protein